MTERIMTELKTIEPILRDHRRTIGMIIEQMPNPADRAACIYDVSAEFMRKFRETSPMVLTELMGVVTLITTIAITRPELLLRDETEPPGRWPPC